MHRYQTYNINAVEKTCDNGDAIKYDYKNKGRYVAIDNSGFPQNLVFYNSSKQYNLDLKMTFFDYIKVHHNPLWVIIDNIRSKQI